MVDLLLSILIWGCIAGNLLLGLLVYSKNQRNVTNNIFALLALAAALWAMGLFFYQHPLIFSSEIWLKFVYVEVTFLIGLVFMFSFVFPSKILKIHVEQIFLCVITALPFIYLILFTKLFLVGVTKGDWGPQEILGPVYPLFGIWAIVFSGWGVLNCWRSYKQAVGSKRLQIKYFFLGMAPFCLVPIVLDIILPIVFHNSKYIWFSPASAIFLIGFTTYAIIVHRLMDIRFVMARAFAYSLLVTFISACYAGVAFLLGSVLFGPRVSNTYLVIYTALTVLIALSFVSLRIFFERVTDKIFFRGHYDTQELLSKIGSITNTYIELETLCEKILEELISQMRVSRGAFVIFGEGLSSIYNIYETGFQKHLVFSYAEADFFLSFLETILADELEEGSIKNLMRDKNIALVKSLRVKDKTVGILILGEKASGEAYSSQDLKFLDIFTPEVAVAIQNSQSYDKIKNFNATLSEEVRKATADLRQANERLRTLDTLKDDFVSVASHELRTPMTAIRSYAWMALNRSDIPLSEKVKKYLVRVLISTERLINLVNDMLNISRIEAGKIEISPEPFDLIPLCRDIVDEAYYSKSMDKKINLSLLEKPVPKVFADPDKLRQVLLNIVGNSLKFTPSGGSITLDFFSDGKVVEISVKDTGVGIAQEDISRLFQKFGKLDNSYVATATSGGTGLGLYISKKIIELMHGTIRVSSEGIGKGATFTVTVPVATPKSYSMLIYMLSSRLVSPRTLNRWRLVDN